MERGTVEFLDFTDQRYKAAGALRHAWVSKREGEDIPGPAERVDGCRVRPGFLYTVGGSRLSRLAGGQLPVPICHQGSLGACFMALHTLQAAALCARVALSLTRRSPGGQKKARIKRAAALLVAVGACQQKNCCNSEVRKML